MRRMAAYSMRQPRFLGVSTAFAPHQAHLSRQVHQSQQVAPRERHRVLRLHAIQPTHHRAAHCRPGLRPGMYPLRHLPFGPADLIAGMWTGASINGTAAGTARILRHMRRDTARPDSRPQIQPYRSSCRPPACAARYPPGPGQPRWSIIASAASRSAVPVA